MYSSEESSEEDAGVGPVAGDPAKKTTVDYQVQMRLA
jgi:hypothetical protein